VDERDHMIGGEIAMSKLFEAANKYVGQSDWKTIAVLKFCLISLGVMLGMSVKKEYKKPVLITACAVFFAAYIPLMVKFFRVFKSLDN